MAVTWKRIAYQDELHTESHSIVSHNDTTATGAELETLTDGSDADALHSHPALGITEATAIKWAIVFGGM